jgi:hypothetical protein
MVDTQRSLSSLLSVLADNTTEQISPQDIRDVVETLRNGHGEIYVSSSAPTSIATSDSFVKASGTTTLSSNSHNWTMPTDNRLTYGGTADRVVHIACSLSMTAASNQKLIRVAIAKTGAVLTGSEVQRFVSTGADVGSTALHAFTDVSAGDYIEVFVANGTSGGDLDCTVTHMNLFVMDMAT